MLRSRMIRTSAPQPDAAPQRSNATAIHYFLIAVIALLVMDFWFEVERGYGIAEAILRVVLPTLLKGGR